MQFSSDLVSEDGATVTNLPTPVDASDAATKGYVDSAVEGMKWKDNCKVSTISNINLSSPGSSINGISVSNPDRVLVRFQTAEEDNGVYIHNGPSSPMTRAADCSTAIELEQAIVTVNEGDSAGSSYRQSQIDFVLGTDPVIWTDFGSGSGPASETSSGTAEIATQSETDTGTDDTRFVTPLKLATWSRAKQKATATFGDGSATQFDITHNFGTKLVAIHVYRVSDDAEVLCDRRAYSTNVVRLNFNEAPASNSYYVVIIA